MKKGILITGIILSAIVVSAWFYKQNQIKTAADLYSNMQFSCRHNPNGRNCTAYTYKFEEYMKENTVSMEAVLKTP